MKKRVLSGIRATGRLHLGNYLGAVRGMLELQDNPEYETLYMVADVHGITTPFDPGDLGLNRREVIIDYLAAGLDPERSVLFLQSMVPEHLELTFYFSSAVSIARMQHLPTFKEKVRQYPGQTTMALLNYPILMSADILVYKADLVPVGIDQEPHLEIAREIARKMNEKYGLDFPEPTRFATAGEYTPSLTGEGKMSKSVEGSYINLTDSLNEIRAKLAKVPTDSGKGTISKYQQEIRSEKDVNRYVNEHGKEALGTAALMEFVELFQDKKKREAYELQYQSDGIRYGELKQDLAEAIYEELKPIQDRRKELVADSDYVDKVIREGVLKSRVIAKQTVALVKEKMGLG